MSVLELRGVRKRFGNHDVLQGIALTLTKHEVVALIGASGSGKSPLLRTINLIERVDDGQILLAGEDITDPSIKPDRVRARIGVVFQQFNLFPHLKVIDNVTLSAIKVHGWAKDEARAKATALLGTIAGDDTVLVVTRRSDGGADVAARFLSMAAGGEGR